MYSQRLTSRVTTIGIISLVYNQRLNNRVIIPLEISLLHNQKRTNGKIPLEISLLYNQRLTNRVILWIMASILCTHRDYSIELLHSFSRKDVSPPNKIYDF